MIGAAAGQRWLASLLLRHAAARLRRGHPEWAAAMESETASLTSVGEQLRWAAGCAVASYRTPQGMGAAVYPLALSLGVAVMAAYQWTADESLRTLGLVAMLGAALGLLRPNRILASGLALGLVVTGVTMFETISGLRPLYETRTHTLAHDLKWVLFVAPALMSAALGSRVGKSLQSDRA